MKAMLLTGIRKMEMHEIPTPDLIHDTDVFIKMKTVGVCGSDIHYYTQGRIGSQVVQYPFTVGHEGSGIVEKVGKYVKQVKPGDRIAIEPAMPCFVCDQCRMGRHNTCRNLKFLGCPGQAAGCLSEYIVMPETSCLKLPGDVSYEQAAIAEPLSIGIYSVKQADDLTGKDICIFGYGPIGMSVHLSSLVHNPRKIVVTDKIKRRIEKSMEAGASFSANPLTDDVVKKINSEIPDGFDVVFECCGQQEAIDNAIDLLKPGGKLILVGIPEFKYWQVRTDIIRRKELTIINIRRQNHCAEIAVESIGNKTIDVSKMTTHRFGFEKTKTAFDLVEGYQDGVMKAMIEFD